uniref:Uncharacterized protein n=1 Tax=Oryza meridionalis TaxID=40149 RepID=A0A0E0F8Y7_9ORYZ
MPSCFTLDSAISSSSASDGGRRTAQGQGWPAGVGGFLSSFFSAGAARADGGKPPPDWDAHGLAASALPVPLSRLDGKKRYKVSELAFLDRRTRAAAAAEDPLFGVYTRAQLRDELDALAASGMFDHRELQGMVKKQRKVSSGLLKRMAGRIERWYHDEGFQCAQVVSYHGNLDAGEVVEWGHHQGGFVDKLGNVVDGNTSIPLIDRELPHQLRPGHIYNNGAGKQALKNIDSLGLFSTIEVQPRPDETNQGGVIVAIKLKDHDRKSAQVITDWSIVPGSQGRPTLASIQPGGTVSFEHRNICGLKRSLIGSVTSSNLLNPESFTKQSKFTYGLVVEEITTRDENNNICTHGSRQLPSGALSMIGPPTTLSGTGVDRMAFLQANITRDNTKFINGATIGDRCIFQMDQGLGIGSKNPFFNRHQLTVTKFINLNKQEKGPRKPPPAVLALHGRYAGCVGDLPSYDAFALGGPHSVRGYGMGELGASRNLLENRHTQVYAFAEHGTDLGSSKDVKGNPTEFFRRVGHGSSYGVGVELGAVRAICRFACSTVAKSYAIFGVYIGS